MATERVLMQQANTLVNQFLAAHKEKYGKTPTINRFKEKYAMKDVIESVGFERAQALLAYYFRTGRTSHPFEWFKYNFDKLDAVMNELAEDEEKKRAIREETKRRVEEWKEKFGESRSKTD